MHVHPDKQAEKPQPTLELGKKKYKQRPSSMSPFKTLNRGSTTGEIGDGVEQTPAQGASATALGNDPCTAGHGIGGPAGSPPSRGACLGKEDGPLAVEVGDGQGQLVLVGLELELADVVADDEGVGLGAEPANLALADVQRAGLAADPVDLLKGEVAGAAPEPDRVRDGFEKVEPVGRRAGGILVLDDSQGAGCLVLELDLEGAVGLGGC